MYPDSLYTKSLSIICSSIRPLKNWKFSVSSKEKISFSLSVYFVILLNISFLIFLNFLIEFIKFKGLVLFLSCII